MIFGAVFVGTLVLFSIAYAFTSEQLFNSWFDSGNNAIRINIVASGS